MTPGTPVELALPATLGTTLSLLLLVLPSLIPIGPLADVSSGAVVEVGNCFVIHFGGLPGTFFFCGADAGRLPFPMYVVNTTAVISLTLKHEN